MLNTITASVPTLSRPPLASLSFAGTYEVSRTNIKPFQTKSILNVTANQCQMFYQPRTVPNIGPSAILISSFSTESPINSSSVNTQNYTICFVAINNSVITFDWLLNQYTPDEYLHEIHAHMISRSCSW